MANYGKVKVTRKDVMDMSRDVIAVGYCEMAHLLNYHKPIAYNCGVYGWNYDVYAVDGKTICTGYRNMPGRRPAEVTEWEEEARKILDDWNKPYEKKREEVEDLLDEFLKHC